MREKVRKKRRKTKPPRRTNDPAKLKAKLEKIDAKLQDLQAKKEDILRQLKEELKGGVGLRIPLKRSLHRHWKRAGSTRAMKKRILLL
ncbi:hypothetical protein ABZP36_001402 [Zizania latifolia]